MAVVLAVLAPCFVGVSASLFGCALASSASLHLVVQTAILLVSALIMQLLAYVMMIVKGDEDRIREERERGTGIPLKPGQSVAFRLMPGRGNWVTVRPEQGQWTATRIEHVHEKKE